MRLLLWSDRIEQPFACLSLRLRPVIVLPASLCTGESRDEQALRWCLAHEWSHIERRDLWSWLLAGLVRMLFFYQPLAWWLRRQLRLSQDYIADARAAEQSAEPEDYAAFLTIRAMAGSRGFKAAGLGISGGKSELYRRVVMVVRNPYPRNSRCSRLWNVFAAATMLVILVAASSVRSLTAVEAIDQAASFEAAEQDAQDVGLPPRVIRELGDRRLRHRQSVSSVSFSPDGQWIATCTRDRDTSVRLWDVATGRLVRTLRDPETQQGYGATVTAFTPDGKRLLVGHADGKLSLWELESGSRLALVSRHEERVSAIVVSPNGKDLCTAAEDGQIIYSPLSRLSTGTWIHQVGADARQEGVIFGGAPGRVPYGIPALALTPEGRHVVAGLSPGTILILRTDNGEVVRQIRGSHGEQSSISGDSLVSISVSPDGKRVISGGNRRMRREDVPPEIVQFSKNISISQLRVWDLATGERLEDLLEGQYEAGGGHAALSPDGRTIALANAGELQLLASGMGELVRSTPVDEWIGWHGRQPVFSPDGDVVAAPLSNSVGLWDRWTGQPLHVDRPGHRSDIAAVAYCPTGRLIATAGYDGRVHVWDAENGAHRFEKSLGPESRIFDLEFSADGQRLVGSGMTRDALGRRLGMFIAWSPEGESAGGGPLPRPGRGLALSPDGERIVVGHTTGGHGDTRLELWRLGPRGRRLAEFPRDPESGLSQYKALRFTPDGRYVLIAEYDGTVTRWDTSAAAEDTRFVADWRTEANAATERVPWIGEAVFTPDGARLATATEGTIFVWNVATGALEREIAPAGEKHSVRLGIAPDNRTLAATEIAAIPGTETIRLYDLVTGGHRLTLEPEDASVSSFAFSPDGAKLVTGLTRGTALVWDVVIDDNR